MNPRHTFLFLFAFSVLFLSEVSAQTLPVKVVITVAPPYPVSVSYYADHPEQVLVQVMNLSREVQNFRLVGSINGLDNNVKVVAKDRGASGVITLNGNEARLLTSAEIQDLFDARKLVFTGINYRRTQIDDGLPEGLYNVCAYAVDAVQSNIQRSEQTCSNAFQLTNLEPPMVISPLPDAEVAARPVQNMLFTWTLPASAPPTTEYTLRIVEVVLGQNPNNAMQAATTPAFFERTVRANTLLYGPADPPLVEGRKYALMVTASDPMQRAVFRNGGRSAVQTFAYGAAVVQSQPISPNTDLFFTYPSCQVPQLTPGPGGTMVQATDAKGQPLLTKQNPQRIQTDEETPISLTWLWQAQLTDATLVQQPEKLLYQGVAIQRYEVRIKRTQQVGKLGKFAPLIKKIAAPGQYVVIPFSEAQQAGLLDGSRYAAEITAFDAQDKPLLTITSCDFTLEKIPFVGQPQITVKGQLSYLFSQGSHGVHPANHTSLTIEYKPLNNPAASPKKAYFTTDANGNFSGGLDRDTTQYVLNFTVNSPYYQTSLRADTVDLGTYQKEATTGVISTTGSKDTLQLGQLTARVYSYDLTVHVGKGFPSFTYDASTQHLLAGKTDTLTVVPNAQVKDGIPVRLYRKSKPMAVPYYEGGVKITEFEGNKDQLIAEAKTTTDPDAKGKGKPGSVVKFKNLVINFLEGDEYYLKAIVGQPMASPYTWQGKNEANPFLNPLALPNAGKKEEAEDLTGPEMRVVFDQKLFVSTTQVNGGGGLKPQTIKLTQVEKYHFEQTIDYKLISMSPPLSRIKGRIVYSWPSQPSVIRPLRNTDVVVRLRYTYNGKPYPIEVDNCSTTTHGLYKPGSKVKGSKGNSSDSLSLPDEGFVVGVGKTDGNGNFEFNIINHNPKGKIYENAVLSSQTLVSTEGDCLPKPGEQKAQKPKYPGSSVQAKIEQVYDPYEMTGIQVMKGNDVMQSGELMSFTDGLNPVSNAGSVNGNLMSKGMDFGSGNLNGKGLKVNEVKSVQSDVQTQQGSQQKAVGVGPSVAAYEIEEAWADAPTVQIDRVFEIAAVNGYVGGNFQGSGDQFVIQAFESKDFGTIKMLTTEEMTRTVQLVAKDNKGKVDTTIILSNARLLIYRLPSDSKTGVPEGEGSNVHPTKPLNPVSFDDKQNNGTPVEWVLDQTIAPDAKGVFKLSNQKLLVNYPYMMQVSADPSQTGTRFDAANFPFLNTEEMMVTVGNSRVAGRLYDQDSKRGLKNAWVQVTDGFKTSYTVSTVDTSGYFEFNNSYDEKAVISLSPRWLNNQTVSLTGKADGYKDSKSVHSPISVQQKGMNYFETIQMESAGVASAIVKGEAGKVGGQPVFIECYVERQDGYIAYSNPTTGLFVIPVPKVKSQTLHLIPKDPAYFDSTIVVKDTDPIFRGILVLPRRKHRIQFNLAFVRADGVPFDPAQVYGKKERFRVAINSESSKTAFPNDEGVVQMAFENVSVNQYTVLIEDLLGDFIPASFQLVNVESKGWKVYPVTLHQGKTIKGTVTLNGQPVAHAKVYADVSGYSSSSSKGDWKNKLTEQNQNNQTIANNPVNSQANNVGAVNAASTTAYAQLQTSTYPNGQYVLKGLPANSSLKIIAVLDTTFLVNGSSQTVDMNNIPISVNFDLKKMGDFALPTLYGFPLTVENVTDGKKGKYLVTGLLDLSKGNSDLELLDPNTKIRVKEVPITVSGGKVTVEADEMALVASAGLKVRYKKRYNVRLAKQPDGTLTDLTLKKGAAGGYVQAYASITDNSFNYPSTYLNFGGNSADFFYLGTLRDGKVNTLNKLFSTEPFGINYATEYRLCNAQGNALKFSFIGFKTAADPKASFIRKSDGRFQLDIQVADRINGDPRLDSVIFRVPDLLIDDQTVSSATGTKPLTLKLQEWTLQVNNWTMDAKQGGLVSTNCLVKTGVVDVPANQFNLRSDRLVLDGFDVSSLKLGGGLVSLTDVSKGGFLVFDEKCGSDLKGHWRLAITAEQGKDYAAKVTGLQPFTDQELKIDFIQLISYNGGKDNLFSLGKNDPIPQAFKNNYLSFTPQFITSGLNSFQLTGNLGINIPRVPSLAVSIDFTGSPGKLTAKSTAWKGLNFEGPGYVQFSAADQAPSIDAQGTVTLAGNVVEPEKFNTLPCVFQFGNTKLLAPRIFLPGSAPYAAANGGDTKPFRLSLTADAKKPKGGDTGLILSNVVDKNGMWVEGNDWNNLRFSGTLDDIKNKGLVSKPPILDFTVYGELQANSDEVKMDDIQTPLGQMKMVYNFDKKELVGTLQMKGVEFGSYKVEADVETRIGEPGFMLSGAASVNTGTLLVEGFGTLKMGLVVGNYKLDEAIITRATQFSLDKNVRCWLNANASSFKGIYVNGGYNIIDVKKGFDAILVAAYVHAALGAEATFAINKSKNATAVLGVGVYGRADAGLKSITGTSIEGGMDAEIALQGEYNFTNGNYSVGADAGLTFDVTVKQSGFGLFTIEKSLTMNAGTKVNYAKTGGNKGVDFDFHLGSGTPQPDCPAIQP